MPYRTRILLAFLAIVISTAALLFFGSVRSSQRAVTEQIRSTVLSIAASAADSVDPALHATIESPEDSESAAYRTIEQKLRQIRDANRRDDVHVAFVYTIERVSRDPDVWRYVVDAEETGEDKSDIGEIVKWEGQYSEGDEPLKLGPAYADKQFIFDEYGHWLSAYAPISGPSGEPIAMLGVDISANNVIAQRKAVVRSGLTALGLALAFGAVLSLLFARWSTKPLSSIADAVRRLGKGHLETRVEVPRTEEFKQLAESVNSMADSMQERDALKGALSRIVSNEVAERLVAEGCMPSLHGQQRVVTVLVSDVDNLSQLASQLSPERLLQLLNEYFEAMVEIVFRFDGTIDRLHGNRLIAVFGAPLEDESKERKAIKAAIAMTEEIDLLNRKWNLTEKSRFQFAFGLHTGEAIIGNIGANQNVEFSVVGESVDIASAIEALAPSHDTRGLVSQSTVEAVRGEFSFQEVGDISPDAGGLLRLYTVASLGGTA